MPTAEAPDTPQERVRLIVLDGTCNLESILLHDKASLVGRGPECAIRLYAAGVSRRHCAFWHDAKGIWMLDLGSRNGTFVNGHSLVFGAIPAGAVIHLGGPHQAALTVRYLEP